LGYLPEAMCAYLMRLGWSPGHDEIVSKEDAVAEFDLAQIGKAPARLDFAKLASVNAHYMQKADDARLEDLALKDVIRRGWKVSEAARVRLAGAAPVLKKRAKTVMELVDGLQFLVNERPLLLTDAAQTQLNSDMKPVLARLSRRLGGLPNWNAETLSAALKAFATEEGVGLGRVGPGVRAALSGGLAAPDLGQTMELLGREETLARLDDQTR
jgi:glutamyl-tRNA synthetase